MPRQCIAVDLGASSGRIILGLYDGSHISTKEIYRFDNGPVRLHHRIHWDFLRLLQQVKVGLAVTRRSVANNADSIGIDSWALDFGLLGENGELLGNPYHYRDPENELAMQEVDQLISRPELYRHTGLQFLSINTLYQLVAMRKYRPQLLQTATHFLMIPDLVRYYLTGDIYGEHSNASTTQLYNPTFRDWDYDIIRRAGIPTKIFGPLAEAGRSQCKISSLVSEELGIPEWPVITVAEHDTASAVCAVPASEAPFAYLSSGTWSLLGTVTEQPVLTHQAMTWNFTNEGAPFGGNRLLKNVMGMWLITECKRAWAEQGTLLSYDEMQNMVRQSSFEKSFIDPDDQAFMSSINLVSSIKEYCKTRAQAEPDTPADLLRCIYMSLVLKYRLTLERLEQLIGHHFPVVHVVGGGAMNQLLCQYTANAFGRPVLAGPAEATAVGNIMMQLIYHGELQDLGQARSVVQDSFSVTRYDPMDTVSWDVRYEMFCKQIMR